MESFSPADALATARRAEAAPWTDYPPTPLWYYPTGGIWAAAFTLVSAKGSHPGEHWANVLQLALIVLLFVFMAWMRRSRGLMPKMGWRKGGTPTEIWRVMWTGIPVFLATAALIALCTILTSALVGVLVALFLVPAVLAWYEWAYARAAVAVRSGLAPALA